MESTNQNINHSIENKIKYTRFKELSLANNVTLSIADSGKTVDTIKRADRIGHIITTTIVYILLIALALIVIFPFYWMIITSLKSNSEVEQINQTFFPSIVMWSNYVYVFDSFDFLKYMKNTIVVAIFSTAGTLITTIFAAFAFASSTASFTISSLLMFSVTSFLP